MITVPILAGLLLQIGFVQNYAVGKLTDWLTERSGTPMSIGRVEIGFFNKARFDEVYVKDLEGDTLIYVDRLNTRIDGINFFTGDIALGSLSLKDGVVNLQKDSSGTLNINYFIRGFIPEKPKPIHLKLKAKEFNLVNMRFTNRAYRPAERENGINFQDLELSNLNLQIRKLAIDGDDIRCRIEYLTFREKSGFFLQHLSSPQATVNGSGMRFEKLRLETMFSTLQTEHFNLLYDQWGALKNFTKDVRLEARFRPSTLSYRTLNFFMKRPSEIGTSVGFTGNVEGPIADLKANLDELKIGNHTRMEVRFSATGLPDIESTWFQSEIANLETNGDDILGIHRDLTGNRGDSLYQLHRFLDRLGTIRFSGTYDGLLKDFTATGRLTVDQGTVDGKLQFMPSARRGDVRLLGHIETENLDLGSILVVKKLGDFSFSADVDAATGGTSLRLTTDATIRKAFFNGYEYKDIQTKGRFDGKTFDGTVLSEDPNIHFYTEGKFDFREEIPAYDFEMDLRSMNLYALNLNRRDSVSVLSARFRAHATGTTLDDINGTAVIDSLSYVNHLDTVETGAIRFEARNTEQSKQILINSDFADMELRGRNSYRNIVPFFGESMRKYIPSLSAEEITGGKSQSRLAAKQEKIYDEGYYVFRADVKEANNVASIFLPGLEVAKGTSLNFLFSPYLDQFSLSVKSEYILRRNTYAGNLIVECRNQGDSVSLFASADEFGFGNADLPNTSVVGGIKENKISLAARFSNPETNAHALISTVTEIGRMPTGAPRFDLAFYPTTFTVSDQVWYVAPSHILIDSTGFDFRQFRMYGAGQQLVVDGKASRHEQDTLKVGVRRFSMKPLGGIINVAGYEFGGELDGNIQMVALLGNKQIEAKLRVDSMAMNEHILGDVDISSRWDPKREWMLFELAAGDEKPVTGVFDSRQGRYRFDIRFPRVDMNLLEPLFQGVLEDTEGEADAELVLVGERRKPSLSGTVRIKSYAATVGFTKARYQFAGPVSVTNNRFELPPVPLSDGNGGRGTISGWFDSEYFKKLTYGVKADFTEMLAWNTTPKDEAMFYGKMYGTGSFSVEGNDQRVNLDVRAETAKNGTFILPLTDVSTIEEADFITFRETPQRRERPQDRLSEYRREKRQQRRRRRTTKSELHVTLNLTAKPNTEGQIVMDPRLGDAIKGRGNGQFRIYIVPDRDIFTMDGQYEITEGTYLFTFYGVLANKFFTIQPGSMISWVGDPVNPLVNIDAVYRVRTSMRPLVGNTTADVGGGNINVNCGIKLTDNLFSPTIKLSITAPGASPETQTLLSNLINTEESMAMQFAYLMLSNSFMPNDQQNSIGTMSGSMAGVAGMEFLSNQISNLISGSNYNIRFGYRPQSELTSEEVTFDFGADIIADKLSFEVGGNYDVGQGNTAISSSHYSPWSVDGYVTWTLNEAGTLKLKGFTRTIDRFDESQGLQDSGVGIYYRQDFQDKADLKRRYRAWRQSSKENRERKKAKKQQEKAGVTEPEKSTDEDLD